MNNKSNKRYRPKPWRITYLSCVAVVVIWSHTIPAVLNSMAPEGRNARTDVPVMDVSSFNTLTPEQLGMLDVGLSTKAMDLQAHNKMKATVKESKKYALLASVPSKLPKTSSNKKPKSMARGNKVPSIARESNNMGWGA